jgi:hypothetical protein
MLSSVDSIFRGAFVEGAAVAVVALGKLALGIAQRLFPRMGVKNFF